MCPHSHLVLFACSGPSLHYHIFFIWPWMRIATDRKMWRGSDHISHCCHHRRHPIWQDHVSFYVWGSCFVLRLVLRFFHCRLSSSLFIICFNSVWYCTYNSLIGKLARLCLKGVLSGSLSHFVSFLRTTEKRKYSRVLSSCVRDVDWHVSLSANLFPSLIGK